MFLLQKLMKTPQLSLKFNSDRVNDAIQSLNVDYTIISAHEDDYLSSLKERSEYLLK